MDDRSLLLVIVLTIVGFVTLAFLLLAPVYFFLKRERKAGEAWTRQILGDDRPGQPPPTNGAPRHDADQEQDR